MSDLCHNCGDCHLGVLPTPCPREPQQCQVCGHMGHTFNFCPTSVCQLDPTYRYWMLCHNCDVWHLPQPCPNELIQCENCNHVGHLPHFCPLNPRVRPQFAPGEAVKVAKRRHGQDAGSEIRETYQRAVNVGQIHPDFLRQIQRAMATRTLEMLDLYGREAVLRYIKNDDKSELQFFRNLDATVSTSPHRNAFLVKNASSNAHRNHTGRGKSSIRGSAPKPFQQDHRKPSFSRRTPQNMGNEQSSGAVDNTCDILSSTPTASSAPPTQSIYQNMQERFNRGELRSTYTPQQEASFQDGSSDRISLATEIWTPTPAPSNLNSLPKLGAFAAGKSHTKCSTDSLSTDVLPRSLATKLPVPISHSNHDRANAKGQKGYPQTLQHGAFHEVDPQTGSANYSASSMPLPTMAMNTAHDFLLQHPNMTQQWRDGGDADAVIALANLSKSQTPLPVLHDDRAHPVHVADHAEPISPLRQMLIEASQMTFHPSPFPYVMRQDYPQNVQEQSERSFTPTNYCTVMPRLNQSEGAFPRDGIAELDRQHFDQRRDSLAGERNGVGDMLSGT